MYKVVIPLIVFMFPLMTINNAIETMRSKNFWVFARRLEVSTLDAEPETPFLPWGRQASWKLSHPIRNRRKGSQKISLHSSAVADRILYLAFRDRIIIDRVSQPLPHIEIDCEESSARAYFFSYANRATE